MTMGALHRGHVELIRAARRRAGPDGEVLVSIFVNPLQFSPGEDYERYPRTWEHDLAACAAEGVDLVFAPAADDMYAAGQDIRVQPGPLGDLLEGAVRPGHFAGMLTVVNMLFNLTRPDVAFFGEKDYQQLVLIRRMVAQLHIPAAVEGVPTVREEDGLALSSRNTYLSPADRRAASAIPRALAAGRRSAAEGGTSDAVVAAASAVLRDAGLEPDYVTVTDPDLGSAPERGPARLLVAAPVGRPRLIDNTELALDPR
jgi:pantoate--beta-alanine ligase